MCESSEFDAGVFSSYIQFFFIFFFFFLANTCSFEEQCECNTNGPGSWCACATCQNSHLSIKMKYGCADLNTSFVFIGLIFELSVKIEQNKCLWCLWNGNMAVWNDIVLSWFCFRFRRRCSAREMEASSNRTERKSLTKQMCNLYNERILYYTYVNIA